MASPHIAGLAAYLLGLGGNVPTSPVELCSYIAKTALTDIISEVPSGTANLLANNGAASNSSLASRRRRIAVAPRPVDLRSAI